MFGSPYMIDPKPIFSHKLIFYHIEKKKYKIRYSTRRNVDISKIAVNG